MSELNADRFRQDPRVAQAKDLLTAAMREHQKKLTGVRPPQALLADNAQGALDKCGELRGGKLYFPYLGSGLGNGALVELIDGSVKYDFITGIGVHYFGHSHPLMLDAGVDGALEDTLMQGHLQQGTVTLDVMDAVMRIAAQGASRLKHCFLSSSGAMANENALKIAFQKHEPADRILAFSHCFAGRSMVMAQITDKPANRAGLPKVLDVDYVPFFDSADSAGSTEKSVKVLRDFIARHPKKHAGMIMELIQGEGGYYSGEKSFFTALMKVLKEKNIAVIADEIQTLGRTSRPFAFQHFGLEDFVDIVTFGKMSQVCGTLFTENYKPKPGLISQTFTAGSAALYAARAIFREFERKELWGPDGKVMKTGLYFQNRLKQIADRNPGVLSGPFGFGAMVAMTVFDGSMDKTKAVLKNLYDAGVMGFIAGSDPVRIRFLMPIGCVTSSDIDGAAAIIEETLKNSGETRGS